MTWDVIFWSVLVSAFPGFMVLLCCAGLIVVFGETVNKKLFLEEDENDA